jgi:hypothetical protein
MIGEVRKQTDVPLHMVRDRGSKGMDGCPLTHGERQGK